MLTTTLDLKNIEILRDIPDLMPVTRDYYENWTIRVFNREQISCKNYLSPHRRDFYKILLSTGGAGVFTIGVNTYYIDEPTILFLHPGKIVSWKQLSGQSRGHYCLFKKSFVDEHPDLKAAMEKYGLFTDQGKSAIHPAPDEVAELTSLFLKMQKEELIGGTLAEDAMQAYLQLMIVQSVRVGKYAEPDAVSEDHRQIHDFFNLLETETANINYTQPVRIKTAKEFADHLSMHPNYLNALLKKHTGQNVSTHIKSRLLEESKALLLQTDWSMQDIGYSIGFSDQSNFSLFFKKNTGINPAEFRKGYNL